MKTTDHDPNKDDFIADDNMVNKREYNHQDNMDDKQHIQDQELEELFKGFQPELADSETFLKNLDRSLKAVDIVKEHTNSLRHKNYVALGIAFLAGLVVGIGLSLLFPFFIEWSLTFFTSTPTLEISSFKVDWKIFGWLVIAVTCIFTAKNAYDIALYKLSASEAKRD